MQVFSKDCTVVVLRYSYTAHESNEVKQAVLEASWQLLATCNCTCTLATSSLRPQICVAVNISLIRNGHWLLLRQGPRDPYVHP